MGELTEVASAKRAVRGVESVRPDEELEEVLGLTRTNVVLLLLSSVLLLCGCVRSGSGSTGGTVLWLRFWPADMLRSVSLMNGSPEALAMAMLSLSRMQMLSFVNASQAYKWQLWLRADRVESCTKISKWYEENLSDARREAPG